MNDVWEERQKPERKADSDARSEFDKDYGRIIHASAFRRLQGKTQILNLGDSDFYRTRLTHSLEVGQVATGIVKQLRRSLPDHPAVAHLPPHSLIATLGFAHDLGHPPFGHGGEVALNYCMRAHGGFEGNGHTLRLLTKIERYSDDHGANLTRRTLLGLLKYPVSFSRVHSTHVTPVLQTGATTIRLLDRQACKPPKAYFDSEAEVVDWILTPLGNSDRQRFTEIRPKPEGHAKAVHKSFDCSLMDIADDIAYGVHDLEDAIALGLIDRNRFCQSVTESDCTSFSEHLVREYGKYYGNNAYAKMLDNMFSEGRLKMTISMMINHLIQAVHIETDEAFQEPLLKYKAVLPRPQQHLLDALQALVRDAVILGPSVQQLEFKGQQMVVAVFEAYDSDPKSLLPHEAYEKYTAAGHDKRLICDHIAAMTDGHLMKTYERLFSPRMGSVFDKL